VRGKILDRKWLSLVVGILVICALFGSIFLEVSLAPSKQATEAMDFTVSGSNNCLRFLNETVSVCYVPFTVAANGQGQLTINCTKMPGGANGYTDIYLYNGYWDNGTNHQCLSADIYPILNNIHSANYELKGTTSYYATYGGSTQQSYTVFFVMPPGGQATFHITYKPI
jgi:hypothetical protein